MKNITTLSSELLNNMDAAIINSVLSIATSLSSSAAEHAAAVITDNLPKYKKMAKVQRVKALMNLFEESAAIYPVQEPAIVVLASATKRRGKPARPVYQFTKDGKLMQSYPSVQDAHRQSGISDASICYCCLGKPGFKSAGGYIWSYDNINNQ